MKRSKKLLTLILTIVMLLSSSSFIFLFNTNNNEISYATNTNYHAEKKIYKENVTSYKAEDGTHKIYWAQGITPPKMTTDETLLGTEGYFDLEKIPNFETYTTEFVPNKGYYDYNKNVDARPDEHTLCYLGSSGNLISWWLDQNEIYVNEYLNKLKTTNIYEQNKGLHPLLPFDQKMWTDITKDPTMEIQNGYEAQKLGTSPLITNYLNPYYYKKDDGYFTDMVFDFFFNGYDAIPVLESVPENNENNFVKDPRGGYFFPIFGKTRLSKRISGTEISDPKKLGNNLKKFFNEGKGVSLGYLVNPHQAHAITVWGAEYDANNNLKRIFITDSDDFQPAKTDDKYWRGLVGMNIVPDSKGQVTLTNQINYNKDKPGVYLTGLTTLDLAQEKFEQILKDEADPVQPKITEQPKDGIYAQNATLTFKVEATNNDRGFLEYEWYKANSKSDKGIKLNGENKNVLKITTKDLGTNYYYCLVKNIKNGKTATTSTKHFKVDVKDVELKNAETPKINFDNNIVTYEQFDTPKPITIEASVQDEGTLTYQWYQSNDSMATNGRKLVGETKPYFIPPTNQVTNGLYYYCVVTNTNNNVTGSNTATAQPQFSKRIKVTKKEIIDAKEPSIKKNLTDLSIELNNEAILSIEAESPDNGTLKYEWYEVTNEKDILIPNNNTNKLILNTKTPSKKQYKVKITNINNNASSIKEKSIYSATVTVNIYEKKLSNDNELKELTILNGTLSPNFNKAVHNYNVTIPHEDNKLKLNTKIADKATIKITNPEINFNETKDVIIEITAEDKTKATYTITVKRSNEHNFNPWETIKPATCTELGQEKHVCPICGEIEYRTIEKLEHEFETTWTYEKQPTYDEEGLKYHKCKHCDAKKDITVIEKLTKPVEPVKPVEPIKPSKPTPQKPVEPTKPSQPEQHLEHNFDQWIIVEEPTYEKDGLKVKKCKICGEEVKEIIPKLKPIEDEDPEEENIEEEEENIVADDEIKEEKKDNNFLKIFISGLIIAIAVSGGIYFTTKNIKK